MKKLLHSRIVTILLGLAGLSALILLSTAIGDLTFTPPEPFSLGLPSYPVSSGQTPSLSIPAWKYFSFFFLLLLIISLVALLIDPALRKRILRLLLRLAIFIILMLVISNLMQKNGNSLQFNDAKGTGAAPASTIIETTTLPEYAQPQINPWLVYGVTFCILLGTALLGRMFYERQKKKGGTDTTGQVAIIVREALEALQQESGWDDAVIKAYIRMNEVVYAERGMIRQPGNTPGEFALRMEKLGLPREAIHTLTGLFEDVRYGGKAPGNTERERAGEALNAILHACGRQA